MVCIEHGSDDESKTFTQNNKTAHLQTVKHRIALDVRMHELEEDLVQAQEEHTPPMCSVLLPLPGTPSVPPAGPDDGCFDIFKNVRRLGHTFVTTPLFSRPSY